MPDVHLVPEADINLLEKGKTNPHFNMISVLIDHDPEAAFLTRPATYYELGNSYCTNPFWNNCQHRMACIGCDFNLLKASARGLIPESKASI